MIIKTETLNVDEFFVAGMFVRTINNGQSRDDMTALWGKFASDKVFYQFKDRLSDDIYCVYSDYESDHTGYYTAILGCKVKSLASIPDGFTGIAVPEDNYLVYHLAGKCPQNVLEGWGEIWLNDVDRKYIVDFDCYKPDMRNFEDSEVKIYLSVK